MNSASDIHILMISDEGPQTGTAGGIILHRLLAEHPPDRLRVVARYVPTLGDPLPGVVYRPMHTPWTQFEQSRFNRLKRSLRAFGLVPAVPARVIDSLVDGFVPDVVLCVMQHAAYYDAALAFARRRRLPLVAIVHDINDDFEPVLPWARAAARRRDGMFYRFASRRLCVSPAMARYCGQRFEAPGHVLYPNRSVDLQPRAFDLAGALRTRGTLTIGFAGNLGYGYGTAMLRLLPTLRAVGARLVLYSREPSGPYAGLADARDVCEWRGFVPSAEAWSGIKRDCDIVWLPYPDPVGKMERLFRHHFPSKLPEYLALGMPVLVTGPIFTAGAAWAVEHPAAAAHSTLDEPSALARLLTRLRDEPKMRRSLAEGAWTAGETDFSPKKIIADFYSHIAAAAGSKRQGASEGGRPAPQ